VALGIGGFPRGRVVEISGPESSGKTTIALHTIAEAQKKGMVCAFIDVEHALDTVYAKKLGVDIDHLVFSQPDSGEQALTVVDELARTGEVGVIVLDSVAALVPRAELEGEMGEAQVGSQARLMGQALRKLTGTISKANCIVIFINQLRQKIGITFGNPEVTAGGMALKFYASVRMDIRKIASIKDSAGNVRGNRVKGKVIKNKLAPPFKTAEFDVMYGSGVSRCGEIVDKAVELKIAKKAGAWYVLGQTRVQGRDAAVQFLRTHPNVMELLYKRLLEIAVADVTNGLLEQVQRELEAIVPIRIKDRVCDDLDADDTSTEAPSVDGLETDDDSMLSERKAADDIGGDGGDELN
jgi:recombination protein RecA